MDRKTSIVASQKAMLLEFLEEHSELAAGKFTAQFPFQAARKLWQGLTEKLNDVPNGAIKEWYQWRKTWQDLKKNAKFKSRRQADGGDSTSRMPPMSQSDLDILSTIKLIEQNGIDDVAEKTLSFEIIEPRTIIQTVGESSDGEKYQPQTTSKTMAKTQGTVEASNNLLQELGKRNDMYLEYFNNQKRMNDEQLQLLQRSNELKEEQNSILQNIANSLGVLANKYQQ